MANAQKSGKIKPFVQSPLVTAPSYDDKSIDISKICKLETWQIQAIDDKASVIKKFTAKISEVSRSIIRIRSIQTGQDAFEENLENLLEKEQCFAKECTNFNLVCEKLNEMSVNLTEQVEFLTNQFERALYPKMKNLFNNQGTLRRKVEKMDTEHAAILEKLERSIQQTTAQVEDKLAIMKVLEEEMAQVDQQSQQLDSAFNEADSELEAENVTSANIESLKEEIKSCEAFGAQISLEHEEGVVALQDQQTQLDHEKAQLQLLKQQIDVRKEQGDSIEAQLQELEARIVDINWVAVEIQCRRAPYRDLLDDKVCQRNLFMLDFFEELQLTLDMYMEDNTELNNDLVAQESQMEVISAEVEQSRLEIDQKREQLAQLRLQNQAYAKDQAEMKAELKSVMENAEQANTCSLKQVLDLQSALAKAQEELLRAKSDKELSFSQYRNKLSAQRALNLQARQRRLSASSSTSVKDESPVKRFEQGVSIKHESDTSASQPLQKSKLETPNKLSANTQPIPQFSRSSPSEKKPQPNTSVLKLTKGNLKRRSEMFKENELPVELDDTVPEVQSPKRSRLEEEKAFDSDDSTSFNISFNTDIEEFMN